MISGTGYQIAGEETHHILQAPPAVVDVHGPVHDLVAHEDHHTGTAAVQVVGDVAAIAQQVVDDLRQGGGAVSHGDMVVGAEGPHHGPHGHVVVGQGVIADVPGLTVHDQHRAEHPGIPDALIEAARIDGASPVKVFWYVILPLARPIASSVTMLTLINAWNAYLLPLLFLQSPKLQTVTLLPQFFQGEFTNDQTKILAAAVLTAVPEIIAYLCMQKSFEKGMSAGALK